MEIIICYIVILVVEEHDEETFEGTTGLVLPSQFSCFVEKLPTCMSKQMVDEVCTLAYNPYIHINIHKTYHFT